MNEQLFNECTEKLIKMGESFKDILENLENIDESKLKQIKDSVEFIQSRLNCNL